MFSVNQSEISIELCKPIRDQYVPGHHHMEHLKSCSQSRDSVHVSLDQRKPIENIIKPSISVHLTLKEGYLIVPAVKASAKTLETHVL